MQRNRPADGNNTNNGVDKSNQSIHRVVPGPPNGLRKVPLWCNTA